jgi:peptide/nickel transport system substrate-binding protein
MNRLASTRRAAAGLVAAAILASACAPAQPAPAPGVAQAPTPGGTLTYGLATKFDTLDPTVTTFSVVGKLGYHVFDPLVWQTSAGKFEPGLAESWQISPDVKTYTFKLRKDVKFHDGTPFNAQAVKFTFDRITDPATKSQLGISLLGPYDGTDVIDDATVRVRFKTPYAPFLDSASVPYLAPLSPEAVRKAGKDFGISTLVGTGPFKFESYRADAEIVIVRNDDYKWGPAHLKSSGAPYLDKIIWRIIPESTTRIATAESGELTFVEDVPTQDYQRVKSLRDLTVLDPLQAGSGHSLMMNVENPPLDNASVRRAIQSAVDKNAMNQTVWNGVFKPACSAITPNVLGYDAKLCDKFKHDPQRAGALLDEAGWRMNSATGVREKSGVPLKLGLYFRSDSNNSRNMATFLQSNLKPAGIQIDLQGLAQAGYFDAVRTGKHHMQFWWESHGDPDVLRILLHSKNANGGTNRNRYRNAEMDRLIDEAAAQTDSEKRKALYAQIQNKVFDEAVMVFFADPLSIFAFQKTLGGVTVDWTGNYPFFHTAWLQKR